MKDGKSKHQLYGTWVSMLKRCDDPNRERYGGRGISVCQRWRNDFWVFIADMGPKPTPAYTIDRIDNDGDYEPGNCRWATRKEQQLNRDPLSRERFLAGIAKAKANGVYKGGKRRIDRAEVTRLKAEGFNPTQIAAKLGINRVTVYRLEGKAA